MKIIYSLGFILILATQNAQAEKKYPSPCEEKTPGFSGGPDSDKRCQEESAKHQTFCKDLCAKTDAESKELCETFCPVAEEEAEDVMQTEKEGGSGLYF
jgi:hypothetical protein